MYDLNGVHALDSENVFEGFIPELLAVKVGLFSGFPTHWNEPISHRCPLDGAAVA